MMNGGQLPTNQLHVHVYMYHACLLGNGVNSHNLSSLPTYINSRSIVKTSVTPTLSFCGHAMSVAKSLASCQLSIELSVDNYFFDAVEAANYGLYVTDRKSEQ